jgi:hypothetical protein
LSLVTIDTSKVKGIYAIKLMPEYMGILKFGDASFCRAIHGILVRHCSRPIREVGDIDLSHML